MDGLENTETDKMRQTLQVFELKCQIHSFVYTDTEQAEQKDRKKVSIFYSTYDYEESNKSSEHSTLDHRVNPLFSYM